MTTAPNWRTFVLYALRDDPQLPEARAILDRKGINYRVEVGDDFEQIECLRSPTLNTHLGDFEGLRQIDHFLSPYQDRAAA